ncbi:MAG: hypothetical protein ACUVUC_13555 [Thermoguttaceae bacterium]
MPGYQTGPGNRLLSDGTFHYRYDNEGNMVTNMEIAAGTRSEYSSDYRNRLVQVVVKNAGGTVIRRVAIRMIRSPSRSGFRTIRTARGRKAPRYAGGPTMG